MHIKCISAVGIYPHFRVAGKGRREEGGGGAEEGGGRTEEDGGGRTDVEDTYEIEEVRGERREVARKARRRKTERRTGR
jgi:hypothetical protein